jgi:hypothetical protein
MLDTGDLLTHVRHWCSHVHVNDTSLLPIKYLKLLILSGTLAFWPRIPKGEMFP